MVSSSGKINQLPDSFKNRLKLAEANQALKEQNQKKHKMRAEMDALLKENKQLKKDLAKLQEAYDSLDLD